MAVQMAIWTKFYASPNDAVRPNASSRANNGGGVDDGGGVNVRHGVDEASKKEIHRDGSDGRDEDKKDESLKSLRVAKKKISFFVLFCSLKNSLYLVHRFHPCESFFYFFVR